MYWKITACILALMLLTGCTQETPPSTTAATETTAAITTAAHTQPPTDTTAPTQVTEVTETTVPIETTEQTVPPPENTAETEPAHSALYLPDVSAEDMVTYFNEVCLDAEFVNDGDASVLQRWESPIYYQVYGEPTDRDLQVLADMCQWLNSVDGFPGIYETTATWQENYSIYFCDQDELINRMGDGYYGVDGAFTFWYSDNVIYDCTVCIRTDLEQEVRNSVILEELYNSLGPAQDTNLRQESIIYAGYSIPQALHPIDEVILKLLYHPDLLVGMHSNDCEPVIRSLYY